MTTLERSRAVFTHFTAYTFPVISSVCLFHCVCFTIFVYEPFSGLCNVYIIPFVHVNYGIILLSVTFVVTSLTPPTPWPCPSTHTHYNTAWCDQPLHVVRYHTCYIYMFMCMTLGWLPHSHLGRHIDHPCQLHHQTGTGWLHYTTHASDKTAVICVKMINQIMPLRHITEQ